MTIDDAAKPQLDRLVLVVGYDGSEPSDRAIGAATRLLSGRIGSLEVVYVAHTPVIVEMSVAAEAETLDVFDAVERELEESVRARMEGVGDDWRFHRRDGLIAQELAAAADELSTEYGDTATVVIVVGGSGHTYHHVVGSVPVALVRHSKYPIVVVP